MNEMIHLFGVVYDFYRHQKCKYYVVSSKKAIRYTISILWVPYTDGSYYKLFRTSA